MRWWRCQLAWLRSIELACYKLGGLEEGNESGGEEMTVSYFCRFSVLILALNGHADLSERELREITLEVVAANYCVFTDYNQSFVVGPSQAPNFTFIPLD